MGALVCDICGGKLVMGAGGVATCESCGMEYSKDRVKEMVQEIKGVVQIDNSNQLVNWIRMGDNAMEAKNYSEAYSYYTKVIETDSNNWEATIKRGEAAYWQGTLGNPRLNETVAAMKNAMLIVDSLHLDREAEQKAKIDIFKRCHNVHIQYYGHVMMETMQQRLNNLMNSYARVDTDLFYALSNVHKSRLQMLLEYLPIFEGYDTDEAKEYVKELKKDRVSALCSYCSFEEWDDFYYGPSASDKKQFIDNYLLYLDELLQLEPNYLSGENVSYPDPYDRPKNSMEYEKRKKDLPDYWKRQLGTVKAKKEEAARKKRHDEYWAEHMDEKQQYESRLKSIAAEKAELSAKISSYESKIKNIQGERNTVIGEADKKVNGAKSQIQRLESEKSKLGLFAGKQKKELQAQIDSINASIPNLQDEASRIKKSVEADSSAKIEMLRNEQKPFSDRMEALKKEEHSINNELTKAR